MPGAKNIVRMRLGAKEACAVALDPPSGGTMTITALPTCKLYTMAPDGSLTAVTGFGTVNASGNDAGALSSSRAWLDLDSTSPVVLARGNYLLRFIIAATDSVYAAGTYERDVGVFIE